MSIIHSVLMRGSLYCNRLGSVRRRSWYQIKYPNVDLGTSSFIGANLRLECTGGGAITFGKNSFLEASTTVMAKSGNIKVGERAFIGKGSYLVAKESIIIGDDALIAEYVTIRDQDHAFELGVTTNSAGMKTSPIKIGDNVWIGAKATITKGVSIGKNSVIGANSVVTSDIPENSVAVGAPCKVIKTLKV